VLSMPPAEARLDPVYGGSQMSTETITLVSSGAYASIPQTEGPGAGSLCPINQRTTIRNTFHTVLPVELQQCAVHIEPVVRLVSHQCYFLHLIPVLWFSDMLTVAKQVTALRHTGHYFGNSPVHLKLLQSEKGLKSDRSGNFIH